MTTQPFRILLSRKIPRFRIEKCINPFMKFTMPVGKRKGSGAAVIDRWPVVDAVAICYKFKISVIE